MLNIIKVYNIIESLADIHHGIANGNDLNLFILFNSKSHYYPTPLLIILTFLDVKEYYLFQRNIQKKTDAERNVY